MPGQYATRGGILDVYPPEADRPLRIEFFGDEIESMRKFDPASQRSADPIDEALLLPLTETPVSEELLGAVNARLSGERIEGTAARWSRQFAAPAQVFSRAGSSTPPSPVPTAHFSLMPEARVILDEPEFSPGNSTSSGDASWRLTNAAALEICVRPNDLYLAPEAWKNKCDPDPALTSNISRSRRPQKKVESGRPARSRKRRLPLPALLRVSMAHAQT